MWKVLKYLTDKHGMEQSNLQNTHGEGCSNNCEMAQLFISFQWGNSFSGYSVSAVMSGFPQLCWYVVLQQHLSLEHKCSQIYNGTGLEPWQNFSYVAEMHLSLSSLCYNFLQGSVSSIAILNYSSFLLRDTSKQGFPLF